MHTVSICVVYLKLCLLLSTLTTHPPHFSSFINNLFSSRDEKQGTTWTGHTGLAYWHKQPNLDCVRKLEHLEKASTDIARTCTFQTLLLRGNSALMGLNESFRILFGINWSKFWDINFWDFCWDFCIHFHVPFLVQVKYFLLRAL